MQIIPLRSLPAQSLTFTRDGRRWEVTIKVAQRAMVADIRVDDVELMRGGRIAPGTPVLPYRYLSTLGNLLFLTVGDADPDWTRFEADQTLLYVSPSEYPSLVAQRVLDRVGAPLSAVQSVTTVRAGRIERDPLGGPDRLFDDQGNAVLSVRRLDGVMSHGWQGDVPLFSRVRSNLLRYSRNASRAPWEGWGGTRTFDPSKPSVGGDSGATECKRLDSTPMGSSFYAVQWMQLADPPISGRDCSLTLLASAGSLAQISITSRPRGGTDFPYWVFNFSEGRFVQQSHSTGRATLLDNGVWKLQIPVTYAETGQVDLLVCDAVGVRLPEGSFYVHGAQVDDSGRHRESLYFPTESSPLTRVDYGFQSGELRVNWDDTLFTSATWSGSGLIWGAAE